MGREREGGARDRFGGKRDQKKSDRGDRVRERGRYREEGEGGWSERQIFGEWKVGGVREKESDGWMAGMPCPLLNSPLLDPSQRECLRMKTSCSLSRPGGRAPLSIAMETAND